VAAAKRLMTSYSIRNNQANAANDISQLAKLDTGPTLAEDRAYTKAGRVSGYQVGRFFAVPQRVAVGDNFFVALSLNTAKPPVNGKVHGRSVPDVELYVHTGRGWRLLESLGIPGRGVAALPAFASQPFGDHPNASNAHAQIAAAFTDCARQRTSSLVVDGDCGTFDALRQVTGFHVTGSLGSRQWGTYSIGLTGGRTLVIGAREATIRVHSDGGVEWDQPSILPGLLGLATLPATVRNGYVEKATVTVALIEPATGGRASVLAIDTEPIAAHAIGAVGTTQV
jgi:hypothetical protein